MGQDPFESSITLRFVVFLCSSGQGFRTVDIAVDRNVNPLTFGRTTSDVDATAASREVCVKQMHAMAATFSRWGMSWRSCLGQLVLPTGSASRFKHESAKMLQTIRLATSIRGGASNLIDILSKSLASVLPGFMQAAFLNDILDLSDDVKKSLPSTSLIQRYELSLDIALLLLQREVSRNTEVVRVAWADSSPMGGFDWLWSEYHEVDKSKLASTFHAVTLLANGVRTFVEAFGVSVV